MVKAKEGTTANTIQVPTEVWRKFRMICLSEGKSVNAKINEMILKEIGGKKK